jgi:hypothetical protein
MEGSVSSDGSLDPRDVWQNQRPESFSLSPDEIELKLLAVTAMSRKRSFSVVLALAILIPGLGMWWTRFPNPLARFGTALTLVGSAYVAAQAYLIRRRQREADLGAASDEPSVDFYRAALERQRDFHRGAWLWSRLAIFLPGPVIFVLGARSNSRLSLIAIGAIFVLLGILAIPMNLSRARSFQRRIDELDRLQQESQ